MKRTSHLTTFFSIAMAIGVGGIPIQSGRSQTVPQPSPQPLTDLVAQSTTSNVQPNVAFLVKASAVFLERDRYQTESNLQLKGRASGTEFALNAKITTIVQAPNQFQSEINFPSSGGTPAVKSVITSNGKQVWIYRPDLQQYSVIPYTKFIDSDDAFFIGISSMLFLQIPSETRQQIAQGDLSDDRALQEIGLPPSLKGSKRTANGQEFFAYDYVEPKDGYTISALIEPQTAFLRQIQIAGTTQGIDYVVVEQLLQRTPNPAVSGSTFTFTPPKGAKQVKSLSITPL